jgi:hypothetical protein
MGDRLIDRRALVRAQRQLSHLARVGQPWIDDGGAYPG